MLFIWSARTVVYGCFKFLLGFLEDTLKPSWKRPRIGDVVFLVCTRAWPYNYAPTIVSFLMMMSLRLSRVLAPLSQPMGGCSIPHNRPSYTTRPAPNRSRLQDSVGWVTLRYRGGHGFDLRCSLNFFSRFKSNFLNCMQYYEHHFTPFNKFNLRPPYEIAQPHSQTAKMPRFRSTRRPATQPHTKCQEA